MMNSCSLRPIENRTLHRRTLWGIRTRFRRLCRECPSLGAMQLNETAVGLAEDHAKVRPNRGMRDVRALSQRDFTGSNACAQESGRCAQAFCWGRATPVARLLTSCGPRVRRRHDRATGVARPQQSESSPFKWGGGSAQRCRSGQGLRARFMTPPSRMTATPPRMNGEDSDHTIRLVLLPQ